jgi:hypothetical protein
MAELNNYPGPRHVLDLNDQLQLSPQQAEQIEAVFAQMDADARQAGQEIVAREADLSVVFARGAITEQELQERTTLRLQRRLVLPDHATRESPDRADPRGRKALPQLTHAPIR